jgi:hypothetical protein
MKKIYTFILMIGLALQPSFAQTNSYGGFVFDFGFNVNFDFSNTDFSNINIPISIGNNNFDLGNFDRFSIDPCYYGCNDEIGDLSFNWGTSFDTAVNNEALLLRAAKEAKKAWINKQKILLKKKLKKN